MTLILLLKNLILQKKLKSLEINEIKFRCNKFFLSKKFHRDNFDKETKEEIIRFFSNEEKLYKKFLEYCSLKNDQILIIIDDNANYNDIYLKFPFFLVMKEKNDFYIIHKKYENGIIDIYYLNKEITVKKDFNYIHNLKKLCVFYANKKSDFKYFKSKKKSK